MVYKNINENEIACNPTRFKEGVFLNTTNISVDFSNIVIDGDEQPDDESLGIMICASNSI